MNILEIDGRGSSLSFRDKRNNTCINNVKKAFNKDISLDYESTMSFFLKSESMWNICQPEPDILHKFHIQFNELAADMNLSICTFTIVLK